MEKIIYVDVPPKTPFLTQYTRRLLLECAKGTKLLKPNEYVKLDDVFKSDEKINTSASIIRLYFTIIPFDDSFPTKKTNVSTEYSDIQVLKDKVKKLEDLILEHHLELEIPWGHHVYLDVGQELHEKGQDL
tara:strand:- start:2066 stop:2458 length:393 start_codon:yes stop_codon:yes gene_type:complete